MITFALIAAGIFQVLIALLNFALPRILHWEDAIARMPLLVREVFQVHAWFISITVALFGVLTLRFGTALGESEIGRWLAGGIAIFWAIRTVLQVTYYSREHWRGIPSRMAVHFALLGVYAGFAAVYGWVATGRIG